MTKDRIAGESKIGTSKIKIFERILKRALLSFLSDTRSISSHQHGFLLRRSCLSNLLVFEEVVTHVMDEGHTADVIYLDFAKAFQPQISFDENDALRYW